MEKTITLGEAFTQTELDLAGVIYAKYGCRPSKACVEHLVEEVTLPAIARINTVTGQENDPGYWAWMLVYALGKVEV